MRAEPCMLHLEGKASDFSGEDWAVKAVPRWPQGDRVGQVGCWLRRPARDFVTVSSSGCRQAQGLATDRATRKDRWAYTFMSAICIAATAVFWR